MSLEHVSICHPLTIISLLHPIERLCVCVHNDEPSIYIIPNPLLCCTLDNHMNGPFYIKIFALKQLALSLSRSRSLI